MDKFDKLVETRWFMKIVALILALLLFDSVYNPDKDVSNINVPSDQDSVVLSDIPVKTYYDTDNLVVTGVPETVDVTLTGPINVLQQAKAQKNFEVYVDLSDAEIGTERVPIKVRNLSDKLKATVDPANVDINVQEKVTKDFKVDVEFDQALLEDGYISEPPEAEPKYVTITGGKDVIERISYVKAVVNVKRPIKETVRREAQIQVLDRDMNKLDVMLNHDTVDVIIPVKSLSKTVPIRIIEKGSPPEGVTINNISLDVNEVKIFGSQEALDRTENVRVEVDVSQINGDTELTVPVIISDGINEVNPKVVKATISTSVNQSDTGQDEEKVESKTFSNLPIHLTGLSNQFEASVQSPPNGVSLTVTGKSGLIEQLKASDFQVFLDLSNLTEGDHDVKIKVNGPEDVQWKLATEVAKVSITQKEV
ncbi:CdaR family protein [Cytobacillus dafuensis]|uniref:YbbR-like domain-containing protein n=1 Tax=Cytobacillus dafuensis TaxID=1742359 RepID=A0A5B8YZY5_CYTDA|nr:CdaR family protein [Cytobacillus dafuensis]QED45997.1 YbbR-like domain-containing protein [Cytobacillus dafuensis]